MQQKVQFISTILHNPKLVILDEPFSGLDPVNSDVLISVIKELQSQGATIILSTHQMEQVERLCDTIALIHYGKVVLQGNVRDVRSSFRSDRVSIEFQGTGDAALTVPGTEVTDQTAGRVNLRIVDQSTTGASVLRHLLDSVEITKFEIHEPTLHDIFVQTVTGTNSQVTV